MAYPCIAILASGQGTTAEAFIRAGLEGKIKTKIGLVISNNPKAGIFERISKLNQQHNLTIETIHISHRNHPALPDEVVRPGDQTEAEESAILQKLRAGNYDLIVLMGYMKKVGSRLVHEFGWRAEYTSPYQAMLFNTHAGLLPDTKGFYGIHKQEHVLQSGFRESGQTLHVVADDYDDGPTIAEHRTKLKPDDTAQSLLERDMAIEKQYLPGDIETFIKSRQKYLSERGL